MSEAIALPARLDRLQRPALLVGVAGTVLLLIGAFTSTGDFFRAYLFGYLFWLGITLGALAMSMVHQLVGGGWGLAVRRVHEAAVRTLPLLILLFIPLLFGLRELYQWARPELVAQDPVLQFKSRYLNVPGYIIRAAVYFAVWGIFGMLLTRWSYRADEMQDVRIKRRLQRLSAAGILLYILTMTFASIDWVMSRQPHYYSTVFGFIFVVGQALAGLAFAVAIVTAVSRERRIALALRPIYMNDLGNLLMTLVILFAYVSFAQFLVNWLGNMQPEITWYLPRTEGWWKTLAGVLIVFHFFVPFLLLLSRYNKQQARILGGIAVLLLVMRLLDLFWMVAPSGTATDPQGRVHWLDFVAPLAIGGLWFAAFLWLLKSRPLLPPGMAQFTEEATHGA